MSSINTGPSSQTRSQNSLNKHFERQSDEEARLGNGLEPHASENSSRVRPSRSGATNASDLPEINQELADSEDEDEFIRKFGDIEFQYIKPPKDSFWFIKPHALNYFKDGVLFRTKGERTSSRLELFLDLLYVGLIANLASEATEDAGGLALLKYVLFFFPIWTVWSDIKDFINYYYNEDLSQKLYIFWIICLLTLYVNSHYGVLESYSKAAVVIIPYMLCRLSLAVSLVVYSFHVPEHRVQQILFSASLLVTSLCWLAVIFVPVRVKIALSFVFFALEQICYIIAYHPWTKKLLQLNTSTALNIEHIVERYSTFVTIAIGEFLYKVVATGSLGVGFSAKYARGVFLIADAYCLFWLYIYGGTSQRAVHPLRHSGWHAVTFIYTHLPLIAALVLAADAGGDLCSLDNTSTKKHSGTELHERAEELEEERNMYALAFFYGGGIGVSLFCMFILGLIEKSRDEPGLFIIGQKARIAWRLPIAIIIIMICFAEMNSTLLMGIVTMLLLILLVFESFVATPRSSLFGLGRNNH